MKLHPVLHAAKANHYCGPSALSALTGLDTGRCAALFRRISGRRCIKSLHRAHMRAALHELGYSSNHSFEARQDKAHRRPTLRQWAKGKLPGIHLVVVGNHYALVEGRRYVCGMTRRIVALKDSPKIRARVSDAYLIHRFKQVDPDTVIAPAVTASRPDPERKDRQEAKLLASLWGIEIVPRYEPGSSLWVYPPKVLHDEYGEMPADPYDEHFHDDWASVLTAVKTYIEEVKSRNRVMEARKAQIVLDAAPQVATMAAT